VVPEYARKAGIEKSAPHDLRRTCARLCHAAGGELEQVQFLLDHDSIQTTERYLGCKQRIRPRSTTGLDRARELIVGEGGRPSGQRRPDASQKAVRGHSTISPFSVKWAGSVRPAPANHLK